MKGFLITGHGRSGTHYMARLFQWFGINVGEYKNGEDGIAHNFPSDLWPLPLPGERKVHLIQVVRDPRKVVESTYLADYSLPKQNSQKIPEIYVRDDKLGNAIRSVVLWNRAISKAGPDLVVKVEDAPASCAVWLSDCGYRLSFTGEMPSNDINKRDKEGWSSGSVPWDEMTPELTEMFNAHCEEYGYTA